METPHSLKQAGLNCDFQEDGTRLVVRDTDPDRRCAIRNRGGEALVRLLKENRQIRALDIRDSNIKDNGIMHLCLGLRQTDQLEELALCPVGHHGLEFALGVVRRCGRLKTLRVEVIDCPCLQGTRQNLTAGDYSTAEYTGEAKGGEEEEEEAAEEEEDEEKLKSEREKADKLRALFADNDYDSGDEGGKPAETAGKPCTAAQGGTSGNLLHLLQEFVTTVGSRANLTKVECTGSAVPEDLTRDLQREVQEHIDQLERKEQRKQEKGARSAFDALKDQMEELRVGRDGGDADEGSRLDIRSYVGRRLFAALGEALFECQRYKSKENEAVSTPQGEMAFIAMYLRENARRMSSSSERSRASLKPA